MRHSILTVLLFAGICGFSEAAESPRTAPKGDKNVSVEGRAPTGSRTGTNWAVVIGVNSYLDPNIPDLRYCVPDASLVAKTLADKCGYEEKRILLITDDEEKGHLRPLGINLRKQLPAWLKRAEENDTILMFFSGHGFLDDRGQGFLAPTDCDKENLGLSSLRTDDLRDMLVQCKATRKVLILDCCHAGSLKSAETTGSSGEELGRVFRNASGLFTLASCRASEQSHEWREKGQGLFTYFLVKGLQGEADFDRNNVVDADELYRFAYDEVSTAAQRELGGVQTPVRNIGPECEGVLALSWTAGSLADIVTNSTGSLADIVTNSIGMKLKLIPAGEFMMGSPEDEEHHEDNEKQHRVRITRPFYLGTTEVTQGQFEAVMGTSPWKDQESVKEGSDYAASYVRWEDAVEFCERLSAKELKMYRLPTEAEWEYACRAVTRTAYSFGNSSDDLSEYAWWGGLAGGGSCQDEKYAHQVGQKRANSWGLYDMHGNVYEWCQDWYEEDYYGNSPTDDPTGPTTGSYRVLRGGGWFNHAWLCRSAFRSYGSPDGLLYGLGFRMALDPGPKNRSTPSSADSAMAVNVGQTEAAVIVGVSIPVGSQSDLCRPKIDGVWSVRVPPRPLNVTRGIGHLINPDESFAPMVVESFLFHEHDFKGQPRVMLAPHTPNPARAVVTYTFDSPAIVDQLEIVQHTNGITKVEGFVGDSVDSLTSIGSVFGPDGDVTGESRFAELQSYVFDFDNEMAGKIFQFVIRKCSGSTGYSAYRAFPRNADGVRYAAIANNAAVPTSRHILPEARLIGLREEFEKVGKTPGYPAMDKERIDLWLSKLEMREWKDRTGAYSTTARLVSLDKDTVELEKEDGTRAKVPRNRLDKIGASVVAMIISLPERIREDAAKFSGVGGTTQEN